MDYKIIEQNGEIVAILRVADGASVPLDAGNQDFRNFREWNAEQSPPLLPPGQLTEGEFFSEE